MAAPNYSSAVSPGKVDQKYLIYMGLTSSDGQKISLVPQGTYLASSTDGTINRGANTMGLHLYDISKEFTQNVYSPIPHVLYGNQTDIRFDPNYNLSNPSGDLKTYVCDAKKFMTQKSDNAQFSAEFNFLFQNLTGSPVNVYVGTAATPASSPVSPTTYSWNPDTGTVTFTAAQASNAVVSIDGVPQAMAPEVMIRHLFLDYGQWDPNYLLLQTSNTLIPTYTGGTGNTVWQIAADIVKMTAPRLVPWMLRMDEFGRVAFYESRFSTTSVETLVDERDLFNINWTYSADSIQNVIRANATSNSGQQLQSISYDVESIKKYGQRPVQDLSSNLLYCVGGMNPGVGISYMNMLTAGQLWQNSNPTLELTADLLPDWRRQVGDRVTIIERKNGLSGPYIIKGITKKIASGGVATQSVRLQKAIIGANYNIGLPSAVSNATLTTGSTAPVVNGTTAIIKTVSINGTNVVQAGNIQRDAYQNPILPSLLPTQSWYFSVTPFQNQNFDTVFFHYIYVECPNSLSSSSLMAIKGSGFADGVVVPAATIASGTTITATHANGTTFIGPESSYLYSNIVIGASPTLLPGGYGATYGTLTNTTAAAAYLGSSSTYGIAYGPSFSTGAWYPSGKQTIGYFVVLAANANGAMSALRVPFIVAL